MGLAHHGWGLFADRPYHRWIGPQMAQGTQILMFFKQKISDLKKEAQFKRLQFDLSISNFKSTSRELVNPWAQLKKHPFVFLGGMGSSILALTTSLGAIKKTGLLRKVARIGGAILLNNTLPAIIKKILSALGSLEKKKPN